MKKVVITSLVIAMVVGLGITFAGPNGNGAPSGAHFNLNIIGVQHDKDSVKDSGHVIFVPLNTEGRGKEKPGIPSGRVDILLTAGDCFAVLDGNATDDDEATFQMPPDVATTYTVWIRGLGKPTGEADMQLWAYDEDLGEWVCDTGNTVEIRGHMIVGGAKQKFVNVTDELLWIFGEPVFSEEYQGYLWTYKNNGQKLTQLRFYAVD